MHRKAKGNLNKTEKSKLPQHENLLPWGSLSTKNKIPFLDLTSQSSHLNFKVNFGPKGEILIFIENDPQN